MLISSSALGSQQGN